MDQLIMRASLFPHPLLLHYYIIILGRQYVVDILDVRDICVS